MSVPVIDIEPFLHGSVADRRAVGREVDEACCSVGFFAISNHGVPRSVVEQAFTTAARFFDQPQSEKERSAPETSAAARGYHRLESKNLARTLGYDTPPDLREQFYIGPLNDWSRHFTRHAEAAFVYAPNIWPEKPHDYREVFCAYYQALESLAQNLMRIFSTALELPEGYFDSSINRHFSTVPANNYPALSRPALPEQLRCGEHTDFGSLTILAVDNEASGLEVRTRDGQWLSVSPAPDQLVVNIGDMMQRWTDDRWLSNVHRVANDEGGTQRRQSIGYFLHPNYDATIECVPSCRAGDGSTIHPPVMAGELMASKLRARAG